MIMRGIQSGIRSGIDSGVNGHLSGAVPVVWTAIVNCTADGSTLGKTSGAVAWDAGGVSAQTIPDGADGYVEFGQDLLGNKICGLSIGNTNEDIADVDFGIYLLTDGRCQVYEGGVNKATVAATGTFATDRLRVTRTGPTITYALDSGSGFSTFYTSGGVSSGDLLVDSGLVYVGQSITNAVMGGV